MDNGAWYLKCQTCSKEIEPSPDWKYCPYCGARINPYNGKKVGN